MIHINAIYGLIEQEDRKGNRPEFSFKYISKSTGEVITGDKVACTSSNFERRTINIKFINSEEKRTLRSVLFIEFNGQEVII